jgi:hypothetical protein
MERSRSSLTVIEDHQLRLQNLEGRVTHEPVYSTFEDWRRIGQPGNPAFQNGWVHLFPGNITEELAFWKDSSGIVRFRGVCANGNAGYIITMPTGYISGSYYRFPVMDASFNNAYIQTVPDGGIQFVVGSNAWVDLAAVQYRAER